jgi:microcystin-dependent protein
MSNVFNDQVVFNNGTQTYGNSSVSGDSEILGDTSISGDCEILGNATIGGNLDTGGNLSANSFARKNGTSNQFLKGDGSVDTTTYLTASSVGGTPDNIGGQIVLRSGTGGFSAGIVTTTSIIVNGNARITGILTVGSSSVTINGITDTISGVSSVTDTSGGYLSIPPGAVQFFARNTAPSGWLKANGASLSTGTYSALFSAIGYTFGGSGSSFSVPDLRGEFPRGWDDGRGIDSARVFGSAQADQMQQITGSLTATYAVVRGNITGAFTGSTIDGSTFLSSPQYDTSATGSLLNFNSANSPSARTGTETRSRNIALLACIKY